MKLLNLSVLFCVFAMVMPAFAFDTLKAPAGGGDPVVMTWTGTIMGAGESIILVRDALADSSHQGSQKLEARRVP